MADFLDNLSALKVEKAELPARQGGRGRKVKDNPFTAWVSESYADRTGRSVTVPKAHVKEAEYLIRSAAQDLGLGVRIARSLDKEAFEKASDGTKVKVMFQGKDKRNYTPRKSTPDATPPAAV